VISWQEIPGSRTFISSVSRSLADGRNVILVVPSHDFDGLVESIQHSEEHGRQWNWIWEVSEQSLEPLHQLQSITGFQQSNDEPLSAHALASSELVRGQVLAVRVTAERWPMWKQLVVRYENACRAVQPFHRPLLFLVVGRDCLATMPREDVCLTVHNWAGAVSSLDAQIVAESSARVSGGSRLVRSLSVSIAVEIGLWDLELCHQLSQANVNVLLSPIAFLKEYGSRRGMDSGIADLAATDLFRLSLIDHYSGKLEPHSAYLALHGLEARVMHRLWKAEMRLLLPLIEERRLDVIDVIGPRLRLPHTTVDGETLTSADELEIGHVYHQITALGIKCSLAIRQQVTVLRGMRNRLAHTRPIGIELIGMLSCLEGHSDV